MIDLYLVIVVILLLVYWYHYRAWINFSKLADEIMALAVDRLHYDGVLMLTLEELHKSAERISGKKISDKDVVTISKYMAEYFHKYTTCRVQISQRGDLAVQVVS